MASFERILAGLFAAMLLAAILLLLALSRYSSTAAEPQLLVRSLELAAVPLPPPPPPPPAPAAVQSRSVALSVDIDSPVSMAAMPVTPVQTDMTVQAPAMTQQQLAWQPLLPDIDALSLDQLDAQPQLQTPVNAVFPRALVRQGIKQVRVRLDVLIDEQGRVTLLDIVENPYPQLQSEIERIVRASRFSAPTQQGTPVATRFIWPINIHS